MLQQTRLPQSKTPEKGPHHRARFEAHARTAALSNSPTCWSRQMSARRADAVAREARAANGQHCRPALLRISAHLARSTPSTTKSRRVEELHARHRTRAEPLDTQPITHMSTTDTDRHKQCDIDPAPHRHTRAHTTTTRRMASDGPASRQETGQMSLRPPPPPNSTRDSLPGGCACELPTAAARSAPTASGAVLAPRAVRNETGERVRAGLAAWGVGRVTGPQVASICRKTPCPFGFGRCRWAIG